MKLAKVHVRKQQRKLQAQARKRAKVALPPLKKK
jgi:hypothetical protein